MSLLVMCRRTARRTFGIERLRRERESAMVAIRKGRDALVALLVALPTGYGKSLIYQVPAMILDRPTIVVSPLIALMADQEHTLRSHRVPVVVLHSRLRLAERRAALAQLETKLQKAPTSREILALFFSCLFSISSPQSMLDGARGSARVAELSCAVGRARSVENMRRPSDRQMVRSV